MSVIRFASGLIHQSTRKDILFKPHTCGCTVASSFKIPFRHATPAILHADRDFRKREASFDLPPSELQQPIPCKEAHTSKCPEELLSAAFAGAAAGAVEEAYPKSVASWR
jgi:hypothetical protein